jgi:hypothetical protein
MVFSFEVAPRRAHKFLQGLVPTHALLSLQQNVLRQKKSALAGRRCCGWKAEPKVKRMQCGKSRLFGTTVWRLQAR